ncbi:MAG TPA: hypothetical protein VFV81_04925 [Verrucomicrobiae bacterium]|nr:hypothetical protein [Verrucomicrobiae bacterium]
MKPFIIKSGGKRWIVVVCYAAAMAWVEAAVVFYLRSMMNRLEPYQPEPFPVLGGFASVELPREFATLLMLAAVGWLAGKTWQERAGYAVIAFGVWDIFYYVFLKWMCGWPHSILDWDVLFLLPLPWWGPVLAPVLISLLLILWGTIATASGPGEKTTSPRWLWLLNGIGVALALYTFMANALAAAPGGFDAVRGTLPKSFNWPLFDFALLLMAMPVLKAARQLWRLKRQPCRILPSKP